MNEVDFKKLMKMQHGIRATYLMWSLGINPKYTIARETYHRHRRILACEFGIDITALP